MAKLFESQMDVVMYGFKSFCTLPNVQGTINAIHFSTTRPMGAFSGITIIINLGVTLCYFKLWLMTINSSLICLWASWECKNLCIIRQSSFYNDMQYHGFNLKKGCKKGFFTYLLMDKGYPLLDQILKLQTRTITFQRIFSTKKKNICARK